MKYIPCLLVALLVCACESSEQKKVKEFIVHDMKDPSSAQFRSEVSKDGLYCGEVNAKNSYGAYGGFKRFIVHKGHSEDFYGGIEGNELKDEMRLSSALKAPLERFLLSMKISTYLLQKQTDILRGKNGLKPVYESEPVEPLLTQHVPNLPELSAKVVWDTTQGQRDAIAYSESIPIYFNYLWTNYCPTPKS